MLKIKVYVNLWQLKRKWILKTRKTGTSTGYWTEWKNVCQQVYHIKSFVVNHIRKILQVIFWIISSCLAHINRQAISFTVFIFWVVVFFNKLYNNNSYSNLNLLNIILINLYTFMLLKSSRNGIFVQCTQFLAT